MSIRQDGKQNFIVAGFSYGQGSSREHAALCPMYLGVRAVIAKSFERIHTANLINFGILPLTFCVESDYDRIDQEDYLEISEIKRIIAGNGKFLMRNKTKGTAFYVICELSERQKQIILAGGALNISNKSNVLSP
jgi:aconitate hydratase